MKYFSLLLTLTIFTFIVSCSKDSTDEFNNEASLTQEAKNSYTFTSKDSTSVVQNANLDMISFVNGISEFYNNGDSYNDLKNELDPVDGLVNMHPAANDLLYAAYEHLSTNGNDNNLTGEEMINAFQVMVANAEANGAKTVSDMDMEAESINLWGSDVENLSKKDCKWYQIGCHLSNFWNWLNSKPGNGGQTNLQMIASILSVVGVILAL